MSNGEGGVSSPPANHKDSCSYSAEICKQFITLGSAGIAFVVGLVIAHDRQLDWQYYWAVGALAISLALGLIFLMRVVGEIHDGTYNVYRLALRLLAGLQIAAFLTAVGFLASIVYGRSGAGDTKVQVNVNGRSIRSDGHNVEYILPPGSSTVVMIDGSGNVQLSLAPTVKP